MWWVAVAGIGAPVLGIFWKVAVVGARMVKAATEVQKDVASLTKSVETLSQSDADRTTALHEAMEEIRDLAKVIGNVSSVNGKRYEVLNATVEDHGVRLTKIEAVPTVKRGLK